MLLGKNNDLQDAGYNVNQARIAIGSGRFFGKGYLNGTQTKLQFVPEQDTDFIFCTVGEEWGFLGSIGVLLLYLCFILRLIFIAERQRNTGGKRVVEEEKIRKKVLDKSRRICYYVRAFQRQRAAEMRKPRRGELLN